MDLRRICEVCGYNFGNHSNHNPGKCPSKDYNDRDQYGWSLKNNFKPRRPLKQRKVAKQATNKQMAAALKELTVWSEAWWGMGSTEAWQSFRGIHERLNSAWEAVTKA